MLAAGGFSKFPTETMLYNQMSFINVQSDLERIFYLVFFCHETRVSLPYSSRQLRFDAENFYLL